MVILTSVVDNRLEYTNFWRSNDSNSKVKNKSRNGTQGYHTDPLPLQRLDFL
jgi:hypothetical protein